MKKFLLSTLFLLLTAPSFAQYNRATVETQQVVEGQAPVLSGKVYVCSGQVTRCGPDSTLATIYSNVGVSSTITNPITASSSDGSYSYYLVYGDYTEGWYDAAGNFIATVHAPAGSPCYSSAGVLIGCTPASSGTLPSTTGTIVGYLTSRSGGASGWTPGPTTYVARNNGTGSTQGAYASTVALTGSAVVVANIVIPSGVVAPGGVVKVSATCRLAGTLAAGTVTLSAVGATWVQGSTTSSMSNVNIIDATMFTVPGDTTTTTFGGGYIIAGTGSASPIGGNSGNGAGGVYLGSGTTINLSVTGGSSETANCTMSGVVINP
jgi:hypothetical protein